MMGSRTSARRMVSLDEPESPEIRDQRPAVDDVLSDNEEAARLRDEVLKLPDDLLAQLDSEAKARNVTKSWLVRESLEKALHRQSPSGEPSCYDLARDLAGTVKGLPKDLADNPKYMQGFGQ